MDSRLVRLTSSTWRFFGVNEAPKTIVVNGNHLEFCQYFSLFRKTRYLIHLTTCNKHIFSKLDIKSLFVKVYYAQFLIIFPYFLIKLANKLLQMKHLHDKDNSFSSIFLFTIWHSYNLGNPIWLLIVWSHYISPNCQNINVLYLIHLSLYY